VAWASKPVHQYAHNPNDLEAAPVRRGPFFFALYRYLDEDAATTAARRGGAASVWGKSRAR